jgi:hypothetical protein
VAFVIRVDQVQRHLRAHGIEILTPVAEGPLRRRVGVDRPVVLQDQDDRRRGLREHPEPGLAFPQRGLPQAELLVLVGQLAQRLIQLLVEPILIIRQQTDDGGDHDEHETVQEGGGRQLPRVEEVQQDLDDAQLHDDFQGLAAVPQAGDDRRHVEKVDVADDAEADHVPERSYRHTGHDQEQ